MTLNDLTANALSKIKNAEKARKSEVILAPVSKQIIKVLEILKEEKYIKDFKFSEDSRGGNIKVMLAHAINNLGVIKPRFNVKISEIEKYEQRYLPAINFGRLILSTPKGMLTHLKAKDEHTGGVLIAYVY